MTIETFAPGVATETLAEACGALTDLDMLGAAVPTDDEAAAWAAAVETPGPTLDAAPVAAA